MAVDLERIERRLTRLMRDLEPDVKPDQPYLVDAKAFLIAARSMIGNQIKVQTP